MNLDGVILGERAPTCQEKKSAEPDAGGVLGSAAGTGKKHAASL
ncbi:hypothetical protein GRAN_2843 [Granulicella sibirica]|uniref:Uncharacterized protein n=1 Tax=Granulicella sibirica TaxID=2479048 RepID=A0A4Q0T379_9BACT|nr:hypothetical protein GRAN_2843 [Granulicella sibirica]